MKKTLFLFLLFCSVFALSSCGSAGSDQNQTAHSNQAAVSGLNQTTGTNQTEDAALLTEDEARSILSDLLAADQNSGQTWDLDTLTITAQTADSVTLLLSGTDASGNTSAGTLLLQKVNGAWTLSETEKAAAGTAETADYQAAAPADTDSVKAAEASLGYADSDGSKVSYILSAEQDSAYATEEEFAAAAAKAYNLTKVPQVIDCEGSEAFLIIPRYEGTKGTILSQALTDGGEMKTGDKIADFTDTVIVLCNPSDLMSNISIGLTMPDGSTLSFSPFISMIDGSLAAADGVADATLAAAAAPSALAGTWEGGGYRLVLDDSLNTVLSGGKQGEISGYGYEDEDTLCLELNVGKAVYSSTYSYTLTDTSLTLTRIGVDSYFGLKSIGDSITLQKSGS